ncbi:MAG: HAD-IA family hydrolase, partial [Acidobacteria bacterium]|nr:HAD-IA family hydrolase [Acidobacteriota bacterium]
MPVQLRRPCRLFIFDLDGTLVDSRADLVTSLNLALARLGHKRLSSDLIGGFVGEGVDKLIARALGAATGREPENAEIKETARIYMEEYEGHLLDETCLRDQAAQALNALSGAELAVVTNKPEIFSRRILDGLGIGNMFSIILGGDSVERRKPEPDALLKAMEFCRAKPGETVMIGDSLTDIQAGKAANAVTCAILGGFRPDEELRASGCDYLINNLMQISDYF